MTGSVQQRNNFDVPLYRQFNKDNRQAKNIDDLTDKIVQKASTTQIVNDKQKLTKYEKLRLLIENKKTNHRDFIAGIEKSKIIHKDLRTLMSDDKRPVILPNMGNAWKEKVNIRGKNVVYHNNVIVPNGKKIWQDIRQEMRAINGNTQYFDVTDGTSCLKPLDEEAMAINEELRDLNQTVIFINKEIDKINDEWFSDLMGVSCRSNGNNELLLVDHETDNDDALAIVEETHKRELAQIAAARKAADEETSAKAQIAKISYFGISELATKPLDKLATRLMLEL